jgi:phosphoserine phosphatase RsbU/P
MSIHYAHLLVIDSDKTRLAALTYPLTENGWYSVSTCDSQQAALAHLSREPVDLILIEVTLATENQCELIQRVQAVPSLTNLPILVLAKPEQIEAVTLALQAGAADYLFTPGNPTLLQTRLSLHLQQREVREQTRSFLETFDWMKKLADDLREIVLPLGIALSTEKDFDRLLETILIEAKRMCRADGGVLYLRTEDEQLRVAIMRVDSLELAYGGATGRPMPFEPLPLYDPTSGRPNHDHIASYVALTGQTVSLTDVYQTKGFDFTRLKKFDQDCHYRTTSCLAIPIKNSEIIGVLQLLNARTTAASHPVAFSPYHKLVAESLASQAAVVLHNHALRQRQEALIQAERELQIGHEVQAEFLPTQIPQPPGWQIAIQFEPSQMVAGDFYDAFYLPHNKIGLMVGDVCDKGIAAAIFMAQIRSLLRAFIQQHYFLGDYDVPADPKTFGAVLAGLKGFRAVDFSALLDSVLLTNAHIGSNHHNLTMFATLFLAFLEPETGELVYINSGHLPPLILNAQGVVSRKLRPTGPAVGMRPDSQFRLGNDRLAPGETLLIYTDGVTDARNPMGEMFGQARLLTALAQRPLPAADLLPHLMQQVQAFAQSARQFDDITLMAIQQQKETEEEI